MVWSRVSGFGLDLGFGWIGMRVCVVWPRAWGVDWFWDLGGLRLGFVWFGLGIGVWIGFGIWGDWD